MSQQERSNYPQPVERIFEFHIPKGQTPERLDRFLSQAVHGASRTKVQRAIDEGRVNVNGRPAKASRKIQPGDHVVCTVLKPPPLELVPENIPLTLLYEDETLMIVDKAAGMVVHPAIGNRYGTLVNAVLWHMGVREAVPIERDEDEDEDEAGEEPGTEPSFDDDSSGELYFASEAVRPGIVHRLDKDTSGILVVSKDPSAHADLASQFERRTAQREYIALVWGVVKENQGTIEGNLGRSTRDRKLMAVLPKGGKHAKTDYTVLERYRFATLIKLKLHTGRTHQIRVHCAHIGHPVLGDAAYNGREGAARGVASQYRRRAEQALQLIRRQSLHARYLGITHPKTRQWLEFSSELPADMAAVIELLRTDTMH